MSSRLLVRLLAVQDSLVAPVRYWDRPKFTTNIGNARDLLFDKGLPVDLAGSPELRAAAVADLDAMQVEGLLTWHDASSPHARLTLMGDTAGRRLIGFTDFG